MTDTHEGTQTPQLEGSLSVQEAAVFYGVAEKTIRRRIKAGALRAFQHAIAEGFEWRVIPEGTHKSNGAVQASHEGTHAPAEEGSQGTQTRAVPEFMHVLEMIERIHHEHTQVVAQLQQENSALASRNEQLAGQVGFLQAKLQEAEKQIALLVAPKEPERAAKP